MGHSRRAIAILCATAVLAVSSGTAVIAATPSPSASYTPTIPPGPSVEYSLRAGGTAPPDIYAYGWLVADADSGAIMASRGSNVRRPPASTLKVLTAVSLLPHLQQESVYWATKADEEAEGSHAGIVAGATYTVADLTHGLLLPSGNDCASAIARAYGGIKPAVAQMNSEAKRLGALHTHAVNPSGLDADGQVSTPKDLATLFRAALAYHVFRKTIATHSLSFPGGPAKAGSKRESYTIESQDRLLHHGYAGLIGGKSGYTTNAGRTFVGAATRDGHTVIYSLMGTESSTEDAARALLDWGFANLGKVNPVGHLPQAQPTLGTPQLRAAARYSTDGALLSPPGRTAGAAVLDEKRQSAQTPTEVSRAIASTPTDLTISWLIPALLAFLVLLATCFIILAARTFRRRP